MALFSNVTRLSFALLILLAGPGTAAIFHVTGTATYDESNPAFTSVFGAGPVDIALEFDIQPLFGGEDFVDATGTFSWMNGGNHVFVSDAWSRNYNLFMDRVSLVFTSATAPTVAGLTVTQLAVDIGLGGTAPPLTPLMAGAEVILFAAGITGPDFGTAFGCTGWGIVAEVGAGPLPGTTTVPSPASGMLLIAVLGGLAIMRRRF